MGEHRERSRKRRAALRLAALAVALTTASCGSSDSGSTSAPTLDSRLREAIAAHGLSPSPVLLEPDLTPAQYEIRELRRELGRNLFFDHILSGVQQTSCGTCHHAAYQFGDARSIARGVFCELVPDVSITCEEPPPPGVGGNVLGPDRTSPLNSRNSPALVNVALFPRQMWNGRFRFIDTHSTDVNECNADEGFRFPDPEGDMYVRSLLTAQAHIPVTELVEMTGDFPHFDGKVEEPSEANPEIRDALTGILDFTPAYRALFEEAYPADPALKISPLDPQVGPNDDLTYLAIADALGHFQETLVFTDSPWDAYLAGDDDAISEHAKRGALLFYGDAKCVNCHEGNLFSDFRNHNIGVPQVGPGTFRQARGDPSYGGLTNWDFGLEEITSERADRFKFRTPPLRGVTLTSPYMHNGAFAHLEDAILHHADPEGSYRAYDLSQLEPDMQAFGLNPPEPVFDSRNPVALGPGRGQILIELDGNDVADLIEFLRTLTDPRMLDLGHLAPQEVPSGLPVDVPGPRRFPLYQ